jgi:hypothetical protein
MLLLLGMTASTQRVVVPCAGTLVKLLADSIARWGWKDKTIREFSGPAAVAIGAPVKQAASAPTFHPQGHGLVHFSN